MFILFYNKVATEVGTNVTTEVGNASNYATLTLNYYLFNTALHLHIFYKK